MTLLQGREVTFSADRPFTAYADGDPIARAARHGAGAAGRAAGGGAAMMRLAAGVAAAKAVGTLARTAGRGGGTSLPGKVLTRVEPHAIGRLAQRLDRGSVVISATNGKTTTAAMVASILERTGARLVHNRAGANMAGGIASALANASRKGGRALTGDFGLFEVDEFWLGPVVEELEPRAMLLGNLFRDQLDRYGELETIADRWAAVVAAHVGRTQLVLNADDPLVADLGRVHEAPPSGAAAAGGAAAGGAARRGAAGPPWPDAEIVPNAVYFGVDDDSLALAELQHASDSKHCRRCGHAYAYSAVYLAHLGHYRCPNCGQERPTPDVVAHRRRAARHPQRRLHAARAPGRASAPRPLQRLQRARRGRADAQPRRRARRRRRRPAGRRARVRPGRDARPRRPAGQPAAGQEPRRRQRGAADARARGGGARPVRRPQRPDRRRPRRQLGLGRRLGAAGRPRAPLHRAPAPAPPSWRCG